MKRLNYGPSIITLVPFKSKEEEQQYNEYFKRHLELVQHKIKAMQTKLSDFTVLQELRKTKSPLALHICHRKDGKTTIGQYYNAKRRIIATIRPSTAAEDLSDFLALAVTHYGQHGRSFELRGDPYPKLAEELARLELLANYGRNAE